MARRLILTGTLHKGKLRVRRWPSFADWKDGEVLITIERATATRSLEQNAAYWVGYVHPLAEYSGATANEMHLYLKQRFLPLEKRQLKRLVLCDRNGEIVDDVTLDLSTTTKLDKEEFSTYLQDISVFAGELGVSVGTNREAA